MDILIYNFIATVKYLTTSESQADVSRKIGLQPQSLSHIMTKKRKPTIANLSLLYSVYNININWLMSGLGKMINKQKEKRINENGIPVLLYNFSDLSQESVIDKYDIPYFSDADFIFLLKEAFYSEYKDGDLLICKKCNLDNAISREVMFDPALNHTVKTHFLKGNPSFHEQKKILCMVGEDVYVTYVFQDQLNEDYVSLISSVKPYPVQVNKNEIIAVAEVIGVIQNVNSQDSPNINLFG